MSLWSFSLDNSCICIYRIAMRTRILEVTGGQHVPHVEFWELDLGSWMWWTGESKGKDVVTIRRRGHSGFKVGMTEVYVGLPKTACRSTQNKGDGSCRAEVQKRPD